jgi:hypothetical protein
MATSWAIQVLTPDYLVEGLYDDSRDNNLATYFFQTRYDTDGQLARTASIHLTSAQIQPTRHMTTPVSMINDWSTYAYSLIALIPHDDNSMAHVSKNNNPKFIIPGDIYVGPYRVHGIVQSPEKQLNSLRYYFTFVVRDAEIECLEAGAKLQSMKVPLVVIRSHLVQGIVQGS